MSDSYQQFSEQISDLTEEEVAWWESIPAGIDFADSLDYGGDDWIKPCRLAFAACDIDVSEVINEGSLNTFPSFEYDIDQTRKDHLAVWLYGECDFDLVHVATVVQAFIKKFRPDFVFGMTWAGTCSRLVIGAFGGGWCCVSKDEIVYGNAYAEADRTAEELRTGSFKA